VLTDKFRSMFGGDARRPNGYIDVNVAAILPREGVECRYLSWGKRYHQRSSPQTEHTIIFGFREARRKDSEPQRQENGLSVLGAASVTGASQMRQ
jgi:hypothetical protein